ncbi:carbohydrate ABC transporter permease [Ructibacterium gallinarum]|uniref:Sugar ABC transporter permease n=1 Tax=Ructibacterium gallinarum TaxID=2779355 RepID=A0A9D5LZJ6_9FIRM|nr:sugar ABC transporter permease [Ructibacterium gallinarum]MBE5039396.1 sugar ABC transporter permease [Ructibacterium gallinarum]
MMKKIYKARWCYLGILPTVLLLVVFMLYPAIDSIYKSMCLWKTKNYFTPQFIGFDNFIKLFEDVAFWQSFLVLAVFVAMGIFTLLAVNMVQTYLVSKLTGTKIGNFIKTAYIIPIMIPTMVITLYWRFFFEYQNGIFNAILRLVGLEQYATVWLGTDQTALISLLFIGFPFAGGFGYLIFLAAFQGIDHSLHEAADIEGITAFQKFRMIDIPLIMPQIKMLTMLQVINGIQQFNTQMIMTNGRYHTMVPGLQMYQTAFSGGNYGYASAMGVTLFVIILIVTIFQNKFVNKEV